MINFFIRLAGGIGGKIIFSLIFISMAFVVGVGGLSSMAGQQNPVIRVGRQKMTTQQLNDLFTRDIKKLSGMMGGQYISHKQAIEMGLLDQTVQTQVQTMIFNAIKKDLGLTASPAAVRKYVEMNPAFADATGHFDRNLFAAYLRQAQLSESDLMTNLQAELAEKHLLRAVQSVSYTPDILTRATYNYMNEKRDITVLEIITDKIPVARKPSEAELKDYYDIYAEERFMTPEYRRFSYVVLTPALMAEKVKIDEADLDAAVAERKQAFEQPEKRLVSQMFFRDKSSADQAKVGLTAANFDKTAEKLGQSKEDTSFGYVAQNELLDELSDPVFTAAKGSIIGPIESVSGWHILWVKEIQAAQQTPMNEVRAQVKKQLAQERAYDAMSAATRQIEDILGVGDSLEKAARTLDIPLKHIEAADVAGTMPDGKQIPNALLTRDLLQSLFTLSRGETTPLFETKEGIVAAMVEDIVPVGVKPFETVRNELVSQWTADQQKAAVKDVADQVAERVRKGTSLSTQGVFSHYPVLHEQGLVRTGNDRVNAVLASQLFKQKVGKDNVAVYESPKGLWVVQVDKIMRPDAQRDSDGLNKTRQTLHEIIGNELAGDTVRAFANTMDVDVNTAELRSLTALYAADKE